MTGYAERYALIAGSSPLFSGRDAASVAASLAEAELERFAPGEALMAPGDGRRRLGFLTDGKANVYKSAGGGRLLVSVLMPGAMLGAAGIFTSGPPAVTTVEAIKPCEALFLSEEKLRSLLKSDFALCENYLAYLTGRVRFLTGRLESVAAPSAQEKLLNYLAINAADGALRLSVGYGALAQALSISRASLYRVMAALEAEGRIRTEGKTVYLIDTKEDI